MVTTLTLSVCTPTPGISLPISIPTPNTPEVDSPMMSVHEWRAARKAEQGAGFLEEQHILTSDLDCACCEIFIGKDHYEQSLYLYPVWQEEVKLARGLLTYDSLSVFRLCGDCAHNKGLSDDLLLFDHTIWQTTSYISKDQVNQAVHLLRSQVGAILWLTQQFWLCGVRMPSWYWWQAWISPLELPARLPQPKQVREQLELPQQQGKGNINTLIAGIGGACAILRRYQIA